MPAVDEVARKYHDRGVCFYAVNRQESAEDVCTLLKQNKLDLDVPLDAHDAMAAAFGVEGIPQIMILVATAPCKLFASTFRHPSAKGSPKRSKP